MAKPDNYKPPRKLAGKQPPTIVGQLDNISVQPWWQYEDDITKFSEMAVRDAMNKELSQLLSKQSFKEVDSRTLTPEQLQQIVPTRWVITQRPSNNGTKDIKCRFCGKGFAQFIHDTDTETLAATPSSIAMRPLLTIAIVKQLTVFTTDVASAFLKTRIGESAGTTRKGVLPQSTTHSARDDKGTLRVAHIT
eukprot:5991067-Amphidinium_carterae.3